MIRFFQRNPICNRIPPSQLDKILDGITLLFSLLSWIMGLSFISKYNGAEPFQEKDVLLSLCFFSIALACLIVGSYYPQIINNPFKYSVNLDCKNAQLRQVVWMTRMSALVLSVMFFSQILGYGVVLYSWDELPFKVLIFIGVALLLMIQVVFYIRMWRIGSRFGFFK